jgi:hypothetical protein
MLKGVAHPGWRYRFNFVHLSITQAESASPHDPGVCKRAELVDIGGGRFYTQRVHGADFRGIGLNQAQSSGTMLGSRQRSLLSVMVAG